MPAAGGEVAPTRHDFEFHGRGGEFFRIWIVNLALSLLTMGIYSAWAKVRTQRYLYGNTYVGGHSLDYDASPWRILVGRVIAVSALLGYSLSVSFWPETIGLWYVAFGVLIPWLINSSLRFTARNSSYRNIRFNFGGTYAGALVNYVIWPILGYGTLFLLMPQARRARDFYYVNKHAYAGKPFETNFPAFRIYVAYIGGVAVFLALIFASFLAIGYLAEYVKSAKVLDASYAGFLIFPLYAIAYTVSLTFIDIMAFNLSLNNAKFDGRHELRSRVSPWCMAWIVVSNFVLILLTVGLFYPWARVRQSRYQTERLSLIVYGDLDAYTYELSRANSAIGEEVAGFFDLGIGL
ncbi:MAG TPA: YjgN family protein [Rhizomicrobium sp.]|nr:YjgN family protein [Rhizomicrobium sp.]